MRVAFAAVVSFGLLAALGSRARAEGPKAPASGSYLTHQTSATVTAARARAAAGDCKTALDLFDQAIEATIDPTLHRDRGLCHEKLGNAFAAAEDYRVYLTNAPNAPDHDAIAERLKALEDTLPKDTVHAPATGRTAVQTGTGAIPDRAVVKDDGPAPKKDVDVQGKTQSQIDYEEQHDAEADTSPVRRGIGPIVGAYYSPGYWARGGFGFTQAIGARLGYSFAGASSLLFEIGYRNNRGSGTASSSGGIQLALGYEARLGLDRWSTNQILLAGFIGFEEAKQNGSGILIRSLMPRGRVGYRHVFGRAVGLEFDADVGIAVSFAVDAPPGSQKVVVAPIIGGVVALVIGF